MSNENRLANLRESIADLHRQIEELEREARKEADRKRRATVRVWRFWLAKPEQSWTGDKVRPKSGCELIQLFGEVVNHAECMAAGYAPEQLRGSRTYILNVVTGRVVMPFGGGVLFIKSESWMNEPEPVRSEILEDGEIAYKAIEEAIRKGETDVTEAIVRQRHFPWR